MQVRCQDQAFQHILVLGAGNASTYDFESRSLSPIGTGAWVWSGGVYPANPRVGDAIVQTGCEEWHSCEGSTLWLWKADTNQLLHVGEVDGRERESGRFERWPDLWLASSDDVAHYIAADRGVTERFPIARNWRGRKQAAEDRQVIVTAQGAVVLLKLPELTWRTLATGASLWSGDWLSPAPPGAEHGFDMALFRREEGRGELVAISLDDEEPVEVRLDRGYVDDTPLTEGAVICTLGKDENREVWAAPLPR